MKKAKRKTDKTTDKYFNVGESMRKFKNSPRTILMNFFLLNFVKIPNLPGHDPG